MVRFHPSPQILDNSMNIILILNGMFLFIIIVLLIHIKVLRSRAVRFNQRYALVSICYTSCGYDDKTIMKYTDTSKPGIQELVINSHWHSGICRKHFESMNRFNSENPNT